MRSVIFSYAQKASQDFARLFDGQQVFDNPKSYQDLQRLVAYLTESDDLVLDFFAGSGTTAHGVLLANEEDGGRRRFICVQLPEPIDETDKSRQAAIALCDSLGVPHTITEITKERVRRVHRNLLEKQRNTLGPGNEGNQDLGFRVFKLAESNFKPWQAGSSGDAKALARQLELHVNHIREGRTDRDLLFEILLKSGYPLTTPVEALDLAGKSVHSASSGALFICLERELSLDLVRVMADRKPERVVFLDEGFAGDDQLKTNAAEIFKTKGVTSFKTV